MGKGEPTWRSVMMRWKRVARVETAWRATTRSGWAKLATIRPTASFTTQSWAVSMLITQIALHLRALYSTRLSSYTRPARGRRPSDACDLSFCDIEIHFRDLYKDTKSLVMLRYSGLGYLTKHLEHLSEENVWLRCACRWWWMERQGLRYLSWRHFQDGLELCWPPLSHSSIHDGGWQLLQWLSNSQITCLLK